MCIRDRYNYNMEGSVVYRRDDGKSGILTREHVEERAKAVYGDAYYSYGGSTFAKVSEDGSSGEGGSSHKKGSAGGFATALLMALGLRSQAAGVRNESPDAMDLIDVDAEVAKLADISPSTSEDDVSESEDDEEDDEEGEEAAPKGKKPTTAEGAAMLLNKPDKVQREVKMAMLKEGALELAMELVTSDDIDRRSEELHKAATGGKKVAEGAPVTDHASPALLEQADKMAASNVEGAQASSSSVPPELRKRATSELLIEMMVELRRRRKESRRNRRNNRVETIENIHAKNREITRLRTADSVSQAAFAREHAALVAQSKTLRIALVSILVFVLIPFFISYLFSGSN
eukprot:TRINITY_DN11382_c0_g1_i2.p1 TRINITY_DN11382_c0_g1~~TRINITY_DN11382_c0_g1_i2.p1  ORF type:complete len:346 (-),score=120.20 TRINITY_DN11382_c0_g1_i2:356-1393(-)